MFFDFFYTHEISIFVSYFPASSIGLPTRAARNYGLCITEITRFYGFKDYSLRVADLKKKIRNFKHPYG